MTKEELKKEAEEFTDSKKSFWRQGRTCIDSVKQAYIAGAEPREKRIEELIALINAERKRQEECDDVHLRKIAELENENAELKERLLKVENAYKRKSEAEWRLNDLYQKSLTDYANAENCSREYFTRYRVVMDRCIKAKELLERLLITSCNSDVLNQYPNCSEVLKVRCEAEQFLKEVPE